MPLRNRSITFTFVCWQCQPSINVCVVYVSEHLCKRSGKLLPPPPPHWPTALQKVSGPISSLPHFFCAAAGSRDFHFATSSTSRNVELNGGYGLFQRTTRRALAFGAQKLHSLSIGILLPTFYNSSHYSCKWADMVWNWFFQVPIVDDRSMLCGGIEWL